MTYVKVYVLKIKSNLNNFVYVLEKVNKCIKWKDSERKKEIKKSKEGWNEGRKVCTLTEDFKSQE